MEGQDKWRCAAVIRDGRNTEHIKIACRDEAELQRVKEAALKTAAEGTSSERLALPGEGG